VSEILIVGTGAMALLFGGRLAASGVKVTLLGTWKEGIRAIREKGIRITGKQVSLLIRSRQHLISGK